MLLVEVERFTFHLDVLAEVFITVHTSGELSKLHLIGLVEVEGLSLHLDVLTKILVSVHTSGELSELLVEVERLTLHLDIFAEVFITIHAGCEHSVVGRSLVEVERLTLHLDVFTEIFITVHAGGELSEASNTINISSGASGTNLEEAGSGGSSLAIGENLSGLRAVWGFSGGETEEGSNNELHIIINTKIMF